VPKYDLVIVDGLHFLFLPYYGIHPFDSRSVSVIGGVTGVGTGIGIGTGTGVRSVGVLGKFKHTVFNSNVHYSLTFFPTHFFTFTI
jgi:hypothetical protein